MQLFNATNLEEIEDLCKRDSNKKNNEGLTQGCLAIEHNINRLLKLPPAMNYVGSFRVVIMSITKSNVDIQNFAYVSCLNMVHHLHNTSKCCKEQLICLDINCVPELSSSHIMSVCIGQPL